LKPEDELLESGWNGFWHDRYLEEREYHRLAVEENTQLWVMVREIKTSVGLGDIFTALEKMADLYAFKGGTRYGYNDEPKSKDVKKGVNFE
jgi:hypothetical protein